jgi:hypothetical protein
MQKYLMECKESLETLLSEGATLSLNNSDQTAQATALMVGEIKGQDLILQTLQEVEEYVEELLAEEATDGN